MVKAITIPQGDYKVGVDFPYGSYIFDSLKQDCFFEVYKNGNEDDSTCYNLDEDHGFACKITLNDGDMFTIDTQVKVSKAQMISFD